MSGSVHYKFKSALNFTSIAFDGGFISLSDLKKTIAEKSGLATSLDTDLEVSNAQTNEVYKDESFLIPKNTSVLVRRVPAVRKGALVASTAPRVSQQVEKKADRTEGEEDAFGGDLFERGKNEDDAITNLVTGTANGWQKEIQASKLKGRVKGRSRGELPPPGYICHRCGQSGHYIMNCPTNGDPEFDVKKVRHPVGIPVTRLVTSGEGGLMLPSGETGALAVNDLDFLNQVVAPSTVLAGDRAQQVPSELQCPICQKLFNDAVLIPCCQESYCDPCIREHLIAKNKCPNCGQTDVLCDSLLPNRQLRKAVDSYLAKLQDEGIMKHGAAEGAKPLIPGANMPRLAGVTEQIMVPSYDETPVPTAPQPGKQSPIDHQEEPPTEEVEIKGTGTRKEGSTIVRPTSVEATNGVDSHEAGPRTSPGGRGVEREKGVEKQCFTRGEAGHIARECAEAPREQKQEGEKKKGYGPNGMFPFPVPVAPTDLMNYAFNRSQPLTLAEFEEMQVQGRRMYRQDLRSSPLPPPPPPPRRRLPREEKDVREGSSAKRRVEDGIPSHVRPSRRERPSQPRVSTDRIRREPRAEERFSREDRDRRGRRIDERRRDVSSRERSRSRERERERERRRRPEEKRREPMDLRDTLSDRRSRDPSPPRRGGTRIVWKPRDR